MKIDYVLNKSDYISYAKFVSDANRHFDMQLLKTIGFAVIAMLLFHFTGGLNPHRLPRHWVSLPIDQIEAITYALIFVATAAICAIIFISHAKKTQRHYDNIKNHAMSLCFNSKHICLYRKAREHCFLWEHTQAIIDEAIAIYLVPTEKKQQQPIIIPKRIFSNEHEFLTLLETIRNNAKLTKVR